MAYKNAFWALITLIFLLPLFFIPGGGLPLETAKSALVVLAGVLAALFFLFEILEGKNVSLPRSHLLISALLLPAVYLLSAILSTPSSLSLFGYSIDVGTFGFIFIGVGLLLLVSIVFKETSQALQAFTALFVSLGLLALFVLIKVAVGGDFLALGNFFGNVGNPLGSWTDLSIIFGFLAIFTSIVLGMLSMNLWARVLLYATFAISTALLVIMNFSVAFGLTLAISILLYLYFLRVEKKKVVLPIVLGVVSLVFLLGPRILPETVARWSNVSNADVRPTLGATLSISKAVLTQTALLGSGPNTFSQDWLVYKPINVNTTPFWAIAFPFGLGFLPTQIATTGILGSAVWLAYLALLALLMVKIFSNLPEGKGDRFAIVASSFTTLFLWSAALVYAPSSAVLMLSFIFTGLLLALSRKANIIETKSFSLKESSQSSFAWRILAVALMVGAIGLGYLGFEKTVSAYHFKRAIDLSNKQGTPLDVIEGQLEKAVKFASADIHHVAISRLNFSRAQMAANSTTGTPEENRAVFESSLARSIEAAKEAVRLNPRGYANWVTLGTIYSALVPEPLKVDGAYENAQFAYSEALKRNPNNPELQLLLARVEMARGNAENARSYIRTAIALKEDYSDAYLALAQFEIQQGNTAGAIASAERLTQLMPDNAGLYFELGLLKYNDKDYLGAKAALMKALEITPDYANASYYLALTLAALGDKEEAKRILQELLEKNPGSAELKAALQNLDKKR